MREVRSFLTHLPCLPACTPTRHPKFCLPLLHLCTGRRPICTFARFLCIPCQRVNLPACPLAQALVPLSPCQHVPSHLWSRRGSAIQWYGLTPCSAPADYLNNSMPRFPITNRKRVLKTKVTGRTRMMNPRKPPIAEPTPDMPPFPYPIRPAIKVPPRT